jgi:type II restriction enzyme
VQGEDDEVQPPLGFEEAPTHFESASQIARVSTEAWARQVGCPSCGFPMLDRLPNNSPVADLRCPECADEFELKSKKGRFGPRVADGAYSTMCERLVAKNNPHLMLLSYDASAREATDLIVIPNHFFVLDLIEPRQPLAPTARRAGWVGCNINISRIPQSGRVALLRDRIWVPRTEVQRQWKASSFLRDASLDARGWLMAVMKVVEGIGRTEFKLDEVYASEPMLRALYPENRNVRPKIRQQLQLLRDHGVIDFLGGGSYRLRTPLPN